MPWAFEVARDDLTRTAFATLPASGDFPLADGEALLEIERFALTANNISYASSGYTLGYWDFFPAGEGAAHEGMGIIPAWGFARVVRSNTAAATVGQRVYGYLPMATHVTVRPEARGRGLVDAAAHRARHAAIYNHYAPADEIGAHDDHRALLQPLLVTSFLVDHYLTAATMFGARRVMLSSASSKTALGLAWFLKQHGTVEVFGLTSPKNLRLLQPLGCYDRLLTYDALPEIGNDVATVYVDFAGDRTLTARIHDQLGGKLAKSIAIGATHWEAPAPAHKPTGMKPEFFFAPKHAAVLLAEWGPREFEARYSAAMGAFIAANRWLEIIHRDGQAGMEAAYRSVLAGDMPPTQGIIVRPH